MSFSILRSEPEHLTADTARNSIDVSAVLSKVVPLVRARAVALLHSVLGDPAHQRKMIANRQSQWPYM